MRDMFTRFRDRILADETKSLAACIALAAAVLALACIWKYGIFAYSGIDLAYFNQVFWNTVHGRPFVQSIHPHLSLGDHAELAILLLAPLYALVPDPRTLLVLQAVALTLPAYAVWRIAAKRLAVAEHGRLKVLVLAPFMLAAAYLLNPLVHNIALFEFHVLPFALVPLFMAMLAYEDGRKGRFLAWAGLALLVREDVAMVVAVIGLLAWMERKPLWWRIVPAALGAGWFLAAMRLIAHFSPDGDYKYRIYYAWLGDTPGAMLAGAFTDPSRILSHVTTLANLEMLIGFLMPLVFLPLLRPRRLVLAIGPLLQIVLGAPGGGELVLDTHYATLFIPALMLATIDGLGAFPALLKRKMKFVSTDGTRRLAFGLLLLCAGYGAATIGPLPSVAARMLTDGNARERAAAAKDIVRRIPADEGVAAGYSLLPALSSRERLTSLHYVFLGVTQFAGSPYEPPDDIRYVAVDADDLLTYRTQFMRTAWAAPHVAGGNERLMKIAGGWTAFETPFVLHERGAAWRDDFVPNEIVQGYLSQPASTHLYQVDARISNDADTNGRHLVIAARWWLRGEDPEELTVRTIVRFANGRQITFRQPLATIPPLSLFDKDTKDHITTARIAVPDKNDKVGFVTLSLEKEQAVFMLDGIRSPVRHVTDAETIDVAIIPIRP